MGKRVIHKSEERVDSETGEIVRTGYAIIVDRPNGDKDFVKVFKCFTQKVLDDLEIENGKAKLLFWFLNQHRNIRKGQKCLIIATVEMMSDDLGCAKISVSRWISFLIKNGYIKRHLSPSGQRINNIYEVIIY